LGLFAGETILKEDLVMIYAGELIEPAVDALRETLSVDSNFYNFSSKEGTVDARFMGNLSRFINHGNEGEDNLRSEEMVSEGRYKIGFYANRLIEAGEELFFNYDGEGKLYANFREKYPFIKGSKRLSKQSKA
jgi:SET domain-containing protein